MKPWLRVNGVPLQRIGGFGGLTWERLLAGGCGDASWSMNLPTKYTNPNLRRGRLVEVMIGGTPVYAGQLASPEISVDSDSGQPVWTFRASGLYQQAQHAVALTGAGVLSTKPDTVIDAAIARGALSWLRPNSLSNTSYATGDDATSINYVSELLDPWAESTSMFWGVNPRREVYAVATPTLATTPISWVMIPNFGRYGLADDSYATDVYIQYKSGSSLAHASDATAAAGYGRAEFFYDATDQGSIGSTKALGLGQGALDKGKSRLKWTNSLTPSRFELLTPGGGPGVPWLVRPGQIIRMWGARDEQGNSAPFTDVVVGKVTFDATAGLATIEAVDPAARDFASVIADLAKKIKTKKAK